MRLLADSHAILWWLVDPSRLSRTAATAMADAGNEIVVSAVTLYEIPIKQRRGRAPGDPEMWLPALHRERFGLLPILPEHSLRAAMLPGPHRDPWDRILIAQAMVERLTVVTTDAVFADYGVKVLW